MEQFEEETQTALERKTILIKHFLDEAVKRFGEKEFQEALEQLLVVITLVREMTGAVNKERFRQREAVSPEKAQRRIPPRHVMWYELKDKYLPRAALLLKGPGPGSPAAGRHWENNSGSPAAGGHGGKGTAAPQTKPPTSIAELDLSIRAETKTLLETAGFALSRSIREDMVISDCIEKDKKNVWQVNRMLKSYGLKALYS